LHERDTILLRSPCRCSLARYVLLPFYTRYVVEMIHAGTTSHTYRGIGQSIASRSLNTLQSFQLTIYTNSLNHNIIPEICTELKVLAAAPNLQYVAIYLSLDLLYRFPAGVLLALDRLLTGSGFCRLNSVGFHVNGGTSPEFADAHEFKEAMEKVIREELISLPQSGVRTLDISVTLQTL
jgi:hypothetical protein